MNQDNVSLFSPFSSSTVQEENGRALVLQFLIHELLCIDKAFRDKVPLQQVLSPEASLLPYDWAQGNGYLNKAREHSALLPKAFPQLKNETLLCQRNLNKLIQEVAGKKRLTSKVEEKAHKQLRDLYLSVEQLTLKCQGNENLLFFLVKHHNKIDLLMGSGYARAFLISLYPKGLSYLEEMLCDSYHKRGFFSVIPELKDLIVELDKSHV